MPLQYSVFHFTAPRRAVVAVLDVVATRIDPNFDDLRAYPLLTTGHHEFYGRSALVDGVYAFDLPFFGLFDCEKRNEAGLRPSASAF